MQRRVRFGITAAFLVTLSLVFTGCGTEAVPTVTPTTAPAAPATPTTAPLAVEATAAPAATVTPVREAPPTPSPLEQLKLAKATKDVLAKYEGVQFYNAELELKGTPKYGGTLRRSGGAPGHFDPLSSTTAQGSGSSMCYGGFLYAPSNWYHNRSLLEPQPDAVESWEQIDEVTWSFKLRPEVYWHDIDPVNGRKVTVEDLKFNVENYRDNSVYGGEWGIVQEAQIPDASTIIIKTTRPYAHMLTLLSSGNAQFVAPEVMEQEGGAKPWCIGYGPFKLTEYEPQANWALEKHERYHLKGHTGMQLPYVDRVESIYFADRASQRAAFQTGQVDFMTTYPMRELTEMLDSGTEIGGAQIHPVAPGANGHIAMRLDIPPFNDVRVRRALSMAIDRQALIDTAFGGHAYVSQMIPIDGLGWENAPLPEERGKYLQYNPAEAKKLLEEAGYTEGLKLTMVNYAWIGGWLDATDMIQFQWKENLNVDVQYEMMEYVPYYNVYYNKTYDQMIFNWPVSSSTLWDAYTYGNMYSESPSNYFFINDPEVDRLVLAQRSAFDREEQKRIYKQLFDLEEENIYRLLTVSPYVFTVWQPNVMNISSDLYKWANSWASRNAEATWFTDR